ncbi:hypothetical protein LTR70_003757 [Exophiala xenobiotica]|nr:hypothetical protein LTR70_003757 [Exophiala xenobiotica]
MTHNTVVQAEAHSVLCPAHSTVVEPSRTQPNHDHAADLQHVGTYRATDPIVAGAAAVRDQEFGHNRAKKNTALQAYVDGLVAVLHDTALPAAVEIEENWVRVDHGPSIGTMDANKEKANSPWSVFKIKRDMLPDPGQT